MAEEIKNKVEAPETEETKAAAEVKEEEAKTAEKAKKTVARVKKAAEKAKESVQENAEKAIETAEKAGKSAIGAVKKTAKKTAASGKTAAKKTTAKAAAKTTAARKTAKAAEPACTVVLQYAGKEIQYAELLKTVQQIWKDKDRKEAAHDIKVYVKPEENMAYYVVNNGEEIGSFGI